MTVYCVMLGKPGVPYDLQYIATTDSGARRFAAEMRDYFQSHGDSMREEGWIQLSTASHWIHKEQELFLRVSAVETDVPRAQQSSDPPEVRIEIARIMGWS